MSDTDPELDPRAAHDAAWQQQRREREARPNGPAAQWTEPNASKLTPLEYFVGSSLAGREPPERPWLVRDWIPLRQVTLLGGDGDTGKTMLALQLMTGTALTGDWFGLPVMRCRTFGLFAEDDSDEIERRLHAIAKATGADKAKLSDLAWRSAVIDPCELVEVINDGRVRPTEYFERLREAIRKFGARLVILDAATNLYGGDELRRRQVNAFISLLRRLAIEIDGAVVLLAHPSAQGLSTGSGLSGSTHWNNAVRSRLYFKRAEGEDADPDERTLTCRKANYARSGNVLRLCWKDGAFVALDAPGGIDRIALGAKADRVFLSLLKTTYANSSWISPNLTARNYAPTVLAKHPDREGLSKEALEAAMHRLLNKSGQIKTEPYGRPSDPRTRLALT